MTSARSLADAEVVQGESVRGGGNRILRFRDASGSRILKVYRRRRDAWRSPFRTFGSFLEGRRGVTADARMETERESLLLWREHGFDVPEVYDDPLPSDVEPPALWMEDCAGPSIQRLMRSADRGEHDVAALVARFAASVCERQRLARSLGARLLIHEHASFVHVLVHGERLVSFDLEGGYRDRYPLEQALELEIAGLARSIVRAAPADQEPLFDAFVSGYGDVAQLEAIVLGGLLSRGFRRRVKRIRHWLRRHFLGRDSKIDALRLVRAAIDRRPA